MSSPDAELTCLIKSELVDVSQENMIIKKHENDIRIMETKYDPLVGQSIVEFKKKLVIMETDLINLNERFIAQSKLFDVERKQLLEKNKKIRENLKQLSEKLLVAEKFYRQIKSENDLLKLNSTHATQELGIAKSELENYRLLLQQTNENHECELEQSLKENNEQHEKHRQELLKRIHTLENELLVLKEIIEREAIEKIHLYRKALGLECELEWLKSQKSDKNAISMAIDELFNTFLKSTKKENAAENSNLTMMDKINFIKYELESNIPSNSNKSSECINNSDTNLKLKQRLKRKRKSNSSLESSSILKHLYLIKI